MPHAEYLEWQEFYSVEPFGLTVQDGFHAHQMALLANVNRNKEVRPEPFVISDFLMFQDQEAEKTPEDTSEATFNGLNADEWKLVHFFQSMKRKMEREAAGSEAGSNPEC
jgi:hypothetical protein